MEQQPVSGENCGLASSPGHEILSIRLRPDGLSFACFERGELKSGTVPFLAWIAPENGFDAAFSSAEWPCADFSEVWACIPTDCAALIPRELNLPENHRQFMASLGFPDAPGMQPSACSCPGNMVLLHAVRETVMRSLTDKYGDALALTHPLYVNLCQPEEPGSVLCVDYAGGYGNFTLKKGGKLVFADVFPASNRAALLFAVNRIVTTSEDDSLRIVCSGENAQTHAALLRRHYRNVSVHPHGEDRNLLFPWSCG